MLLIDRALLVAAALWLGVGPAVASDHERYLYRDIFTPFFAAQPAGNGAMLYWAARPRSCANQRFYEPKPANTTRIFVVGGSIANLFLSVRKQPEVRLDRLLAKAFPARRFEAIDCGMAAYDSLRESLVLGEVLGHRPDVVILMTGNNEGYGEGAVSWPLRGNLWGLDRFPVVGALRARLGRKYLAAHAGMVNSSPGARSRWLAAFESNLRGMVRAAKQAGVPVVLCALPVNSADMPPDVKAIPSGSEFQQASKALARGDARAAAAGFERCVQRSPQEPFGYYYLGKALEALGRFDEAGASYRAAVDNDRLVRCSPAINAIIRRVALEEGEPLADIEEAFTEAAPHKLLGREMFVDGVHWHLEYNRLANKAVLEALLALAEKGWPGLGSTSQRSTKAIAAAKRFCAADRIRLNRESKRLADEQRLLYAVSAVVDFRAQRPVTPLSQRAQAFLDMIDNKDLVCGLSRRRQWVLRRMRQNSWSSGRVGDLVRAWPAVLLHAAQSCQRRRMHG